MVERKSAIDPDTISSNDCSVADRHIRVLIFGQLLDGRFWRSRCPISTRASSVMDGGNLPVLPDRLRVGHVDCTPEQRPEEPSLNVD